MRGNVCFDFSRIDPCDYRRSIVLDLFSVGLVEKKAKFKLIFDYFTKIDEANIILFIVLTSQLYKSCGYEQISLCNNDLEEGELEKITYVSISKNSSSFDHMDKLLFIDNLEKGKILQKAKVKFRKFTEIENHIRNSRLIKINMSNYLSNICDLPNNEEEYDRFINKFNL